MNKTKGLLLVLSGPSGAGKGTLIKGLLSKHPELFLSVSCTTRLPRRGEKQGKDYRFVNVKQFQDMIKRKGFLEWANVHGDYYGTPLKPVLSRLCRNRDVLLELDVQGAMKVKKKVTSCVLVFIATKSLSTLALRLRLRQTEREGEIKRRLKVARRELKVVPFYDYIVINEKKEKALRDLEAILDAVRCEIPRARYRLNV